ncbi:DUF5343 domain-containing protein [Actinomadura meridiana]|uniref:DUF5343 domain-containing protein n=1 Tax=Actinomadura meridiana TaxID=559626 RepID=A0ABP8CJV0_9ACTN
MLTKRYLASTKNLGPILDRMVEGVAPDKFNAEHLKSIGFTSSNDRALIPVLKDLKFLTADGTPTVRYQEYRDRSRSKEVMGESLREAYGDIFRIREIPTPADRPAIEGLFKSKHNSSDRVAQLQAMTFMALLSKAVLASGRDRGREVEGDENSDRFREVSVETTQPTLSTKSSVLTTELHYTIQIHLPATKDIEVFNAIFRSLRDNLLT